MWTIGHPTEEVIQRTAAVPRVIYQTEEGKGDGDITIKVCANSSWVNDDSYVNSVGAKGGRKIKTFPNGHKFFRANDLGIRFVGREVYLPLPFRTPMNRSPYSKRPRRFERCCASVLQTCKILFF